MQYAIYMAVLHMKERPSRVGLSYHSRVDKDFSQTRPKRASENFLLLKNLGANPGVTICTRTRQKQWLMAFVRRSISSKNLIGFPAPPVNTPGFWIQAVNMAVSSVVFHTLGCIASIVSKPENSP